MAIGLHRAVNKQVVENILIIFHEDAGPYCELQFYDISEYDIWVFDFASVFLPSPPEKSIIRIHGATISRL